MQRMSLTAIECDKVCRIAGIGGMMAELGPTG
jgi:hypothetical protein